MQSSAPMGQSGGLIHGREELAQWQGRRPGGQTLWPAAEAIGCVLRSAMRITYVRVPRVPSDLAE
jgi:hypothetical protein